MVFTDFDYVFIYFSKFSASLSSSYSSASYILDNFANFSFCFAKFTFSVS